MNLDNAISIAEKSGFDYSTEQGREAINSTVERRFGDFLATYDGGCNIPQHFQPIEIALITLYFEG